MSTDRARVLVSLVRLQVQVGRTTLGEFARRVASADWPADADIALVTVVGGKVPLRWTAQDTALSLALPGGRGAIYLVVAGRFERPGLVAALRGEGTDAAARDALIIDLGIDEGVVPS